MSRHRASRSVQHYNDYDGDDDDAFFSDNEDYEDDANDYETQQYMFSNRGSGAQHRNGGAEGGQQQSNSFESLDDEKRCLALSCVEHIRDAIPQLGEQLSQLDLQTIVLATDCNAEAALDAALTLLEKHQSEPQTAPNTRRKPQPKPKKTKAKKKKPDNKSPASAINPADAKTAAEHADRSSSPIPKVPALKRAQQQRDVQALFSAERSGEKPLLHLVVVGHVDAGKSTLMGHTLLELGNISERSMAKLAHESNRTGKSSFRYAWVLDEASEERARGITMDVAQAVFETASKRVHLLDAPGHKDFIPNMIAGATQADCALLVVDATRGEFETGFEGGGQTVEHAILVRSLGVGELCVVVNKMDTWQWSQQRFDEIVGRMRPFLSKIGFAASKVQFVPVSGLSGENLVQPPTANELCSWYRGPTLASVIDNFTVPKRDIDLPLRLVITDMFQSSGNGVLVAGRLETGVLAAGDTVYVYPLKEPVSIKSLHIDNVPCQTAFAGDSVSARLSGLDMASVTRGNVLCDVLRPVQIAHSLEVRVVMHKLTLPLTVGAPLLLHAHSVSAPSTVERLIATIDKQSGEVLGTRPRFLLSDACALVALRLVQPICLDTFADCKQLGRVALRIGGVTVGAGIVTGINQ